MENSYAQLLNNNTLKFKEFKNVSRYQKISSMMCTNNWIPPKDNLRSIHELYLECKKKANVGHWLNELRLVYNACSDMLDQGSYVFALLYFKSYPMVFNEITMLYNWFFDVLQHICDREKTDPSFNIRQFFEKMFSTDYLKKCIKNIYLDSDKNIISVNMVEGKELAIEDFINIFREFVLQNKSCCFLTLVHYFLCFKDCAQSLQWSLKKIVSSKTKPLNFDLHHWISQHMKKVLNYIKNKNMVSSIYKIFSPQPGDYLICIPIPSNVTQFHVKYDVLDQINKVHETSKVCVMDLLISSNFMQQHTEFLENLNLYIYVSQYQTCSSLLPELKYLYYKCISIKELMSASDIMLKESIENYKTEEGKEDYHNMVIQAWLVQKMQAVQNQNLNLSYFCGSLWPCSMEKSIFDNYIAKNLPDSEQKEFFYDFLKRFRSNRYNSYLIIVLCFFVCSVEWKNISVETLTLSNIRIPRKKEHEGNERTAVDYKNVMLLLSEGDVKVWNMLFEQSDIHLYQLNSWFYKNIKHFVENSSSETRCEKFRIPLILIKEYMTFLLRHKHNLPRYVLLHLDINIQKQKICNITNNTNLHGMVEDFVQEVKTSVDFVTSENIQLVLNVVNYVNCFLSMRKFQVDRTENGLSVHQDKTHDINESQNLNSRTEYQVRPEQSPSSTEMDHSEPTVSSENSEPTVSSENSEPIVIVTKAIIEHSQSDNTRKRTLETISNDTECTNGKKARTDSSNSNHEHVINNSSDTSKDTAGNSVPNTSLSESTKHSDLNIIVNETNVLNTKVSVFEDQFKKKIDNLNKEYSNLITGVTIKKENEISSKSKPTSSANHSTVIDNGDMNNDSSDESDIVVLGPGPPKQFDLITLDEHGEEINANAKTENKQDSDEHEENLHSEQTCEPDGKTDNVNEDKKEEMMENNEIEENNSTCVYPKKWSQEMIDFYSEDINADIYKRSIQAKVFNSRPDQWRIDYHNSYRFNDAQFSYSKMCENCGSRMHDCKNCPKPCFSICPMCGGTGHAPDRCPDAQCLNCGKKTDEYLFNCDECDQKIVLKIKCDVCHGLYHSSDDCPHLWRSMEFTARKGKLKLAPASQNSQYCSNCAKQGHMINACPHLSAEHPLRQDNTWKVHSEAYAERSVHYKLRVSQQVSKVLLSKRGMAELQKLSNQSGVNIEYLVDVGVNLLTYKANPVQSHFIRSQLKKFLFGS